MTSQPTRSSWAIRRILVTHRYPLPADARASVHHDSWRRILYVYFVQLLIALFECQQHGPLLTGIRPRATGQGHPTTGNHQPDNGLPSADHGQPVLSGS